MNRRLLIIGAGGHGKVVADAALSMGDWYEVAFLDDRACTIGSTLGLPVLGPTSRLPELASIYTSAAVAIGAASERLRTLEWCRSIGLDLPLIVHPSAVVSTFAQLKEGCVVCAQAAVNAGSILQVGCIVNTGSSIDHDCELDEGVHICPGAHLAGSVRVGARSWIGMGSCIRQGLTIGADVTVAAGAVVVSNVPAATTVMGVPAKPRSTK